MKLWSVRYRYRPAVDWVRLPNSEEEFARWSFAERKQHLSRLDGSRAELVRDGEVIDFAEGSRDPRSEAAHGA